MLNPDPLARYGDVALDRRDIRTSQALSIDVRAITGGIVLPDETRLVEPGTFTLSVIAPSGTWPVGEIRFMVDGIEVSLVGHQTGRPGLREITPDHVIAARNPRYADELRRWLGVFAAVQRFPTH